MTIPQKIIDQIHEIAKKRFPLEACGFLVAAAGAEKGFEIRVIEAKNSAEFPARDWRIASKDQVEAAAVGPILEVWHSHPDRPPKPSESDLASCEAAGLPFRIIATQTGEHQVIEPSGYVMPLTGRRFIHGVIDCYTLVQDYFRQKHGIALPDGERPDRWWETDMDIYENGYEAAGFRVVSTDPRDAQMDDCLAIRLRSQKWNHTAIYQDACRILHHPPFKASCREHFGQYWQHRTLKVLRHESLC